MSLNDTIKYNETIKRLQNTYKKFQTKEDLWYGKVVSVVIPVPYINDEGILAYQDQTMYNIVSYNGGYLMHDCFYKYKINESRQCIVAYLKKPDDVARTIKEEKASTVLGKLNKGYKYSYGALNEYGTMIIQPLFDGIEFGGDNTFICEYKGKYGYLDSFGRQLTPIKYNFAYKFNDGVARVKTWRNQTGYIDIESPINNIFDETQYIKFGNFVGTDFENGSFVIYQLGTKVRYDRKGNYLEAGPTKIYR